MRFNEEEKLMKYSRS